MAYTLEEEIALLTAGIEGESAQTRIRALVNVKHKLQGSLQEQATQHATALEAKDGEIATMTSGHETAVGEAKTAWRAEADQDLALADLGIASPFDRKTARDFHAGIEGAPPIDEWAKAAQADPKAREGWPTSVESLFGKPGRTTPNIDKDTGDPSKLTPERMAKMSDEEFDKATGAI